MILLKTLVKSLIEEHINISPITRKATYEKRERDEKKSSQSTPIYDNI